MNCKEVQDKIPEYLEEDLAEAMMEAMHSHIDNCQACQHEVKAYEMTWDALDAWEDYMPSPNFQVEIPAEVVDEKPKVTFLEWFSSLFTFRVPAWTTAAVLMLAFFAGRFMMPAKTVVVQAPPQVIYTSAPEKAEVDLASFEALEMLGDQEVSIPRTTELVTQEDHKMKNKKDVLPLPEWEGEGELDRVDVKSVFNI